MAGFWWQWGWLRRSWQFRRELVPAQCRLNLRRQIRRDRDGRLRWRLLPNYRVGLGRWRDRGRLLGFCPKLIEGGFDLVDRAVGVKDGRGRRVNIFARWHVLVKRIRFNLWLQIFGFINWRLRWQ